ncbi:uncharacterized protein LOC142338525 [Convolutriloba macropyga]|uniref:uncharacterized protein LOC142338525 n=1 Tax=Convolutriloba macropyga TaxID=536237 RepID=UPI003F5206E8
MDCFQFSLTLSDCAINLLHSQNLFAYLTSEVPLQSLGNLQITNNTFQFTAPVKKQEAVTLKRKPNDTTFAKAQKVTRINVVAPKPLVTSPFVQIGSINPEFGRMPDGRPICPVCHATFGKMQEAKRHFQTKHSGFSFKCEICGLEISRRDNFKSHLSKKHALSTELVNLMADKAVS